MKDSSKTRWIEKHSTFETVFDLFEYIVITLNEMCTHKWWLWFYSNNDEWSWDAKTNTMANELRHSMVSFGHIFSSFVPKRCWRQCNQSSPLCQEGLSRYTLVSRKLTKLSYTEIRNAIDCVPTHVRLINNLSSCEIKAWKKKSGLKRIRTHDLCDTRAVL